MLSIYSLVSASGQIEIIYLQEYLDDFTLENARPRHILSYSGEIWRGQVKLILDRYSMQSSCTNMSKDQMDESQQQFSLGSSPFLWVCGQNFNGKLSHSFDTHT